MNIVIINGFPCSGKDLFCEYCQSIMGDKCKVVSSVDYVKEVADYCGWNGAKNPADRQFLADLKYILSTWKDIPFKKTIEKVDKYEKENNELVFIMCREPKEIQRFKEYYKGLTLYIQRDLAEDEAKRNIKNRADRGVKNMCYDIRIENNGTKEELRLKAEEFCRQIKNM